MEQRFKSMSLFDFQDKFPDADSCLSHLADLKWGSGYKRPKCGHDRSCGGVIPALQAVHEVPLCGIPHSWHALPQGKVRPAQGLLDRVLHIDQQKGVLLHRARPQARTGAEDLLEVQKEGDEGHEELGQAPHYRNGGGDETVFGQQEEGVRGRQNAEKKLVVVGIEKKGRGVSRLYARVIPHADAASLGAFMKDHIAPAAKVTTDKWTGYGPLAKDFENMVQIPSGKKGGNFPELHRAVMMLKAWVRGMHHHVEHLQDYLDEYCYRFNRSFMKEGIFDNLMMRMVKAPPCPIKNISG